MRQLNPPASLEALLARKRGRDAQAAAGTADAARLRELRSWQAGRLERTYGDLRREPRYAAAVEFFLTDLYGPQTFLDRDRELDRALRYLRRALPAAALDVLARAVELDLLTADLDAAMVGVLVPGVITPVSYAAAYRSVGQPDARARQIELVIAIGTTLGRIVRHAWIALALRVAHGPAHAAGFGALQDFLERGFAAFRRMRGTGHFLQTIRERETCCMQTILAGGAAPWGAAERRAEGAP